MSHSGRWNLTMPERPANNRAMAEGRARPGPGGDFDAAEMRAGNPATLGLLAGSLCWGRRARRISVFLPDDGVGCGCLCVFARALGSSKGARSRWVYKWFRHAPHGSGTQKISGGRSRSLIECSSWEAGWLRETAAADYYYLLLPLCCSSAQPSSAGPGRRDLTSAPSDRRDWRGTGTWEMRMTLGCWETLLDTATAAATARPCHTPYALPVASSAGCATGRSTDAVTGWADRRRCCRVESGESAQP
jgi:hypothetical protein